MPNEAFGNKPLKNFLRAMHVARILHRIDAEPSLFRSLRMCPAVNLILLRPCL